MSLPRISKGGVLLATGALALGMLLNPAPAQAHNNGVALTPPMGWSSWNIFGCDIDQWKIMDIADAIVEGGLRDAGYIYVNVDDCWQAQERLPNGELTWDKKRFPDGIPALAKYMHDRGLKLGIYGNPGTQSCAVWAGNYTGKMGSLGHEYQDARTFARWGVDYLKYDDCWSKVEGVNAKEAFTKMSRALKATGRPIVYSIHNMPQLPIRDWYPEVANMWRTTPDIFDNWYSVAGIALATLPVAHHSRPGAWNDPDMLEIGNENLNREEATSHMALWAMMAAPLIMGNDIRKMSKTDYWILANPLAIRVDQDRLGKAAHIVKHGSQMVLARPLTNGEWAVSFTNFSAERARVTVTLQELGLQGSWRFREAFHSRSGVTDKGLSATVNPHDSYLYVLTPHK
ncbi:MAG TPA: glycoside hydrolase family 27 protein [Corynebacteriales bacterium]|nr:glycoside hydrolase family 27 protein [Mycobacteriales bacterium]